MDRPADAVWWHDATPAPSHRHAYRVRPLAGERAGAGLVEVLEHDRLGRLLAVGGAARFIEADPAYVELAAHVPLCGRPRAGARVLVVGGDDGRLAIEALRHDVGAVTLVCDPAVLAMARRWLPEAAALQDPRLQVVDAGDPAAPARAAAAGGYDLIIADLFAIGPALDPAPLLAPGGLHAAAAPCALRADAQGVVPTPAWRRGGGPGAAVYAAGVPLSPGGFVAFRLDGPDAAALAEPRALVGRHYGPDVHRAVFALPTWWRGGPRELPPEPAVDGDPSDWWHEHDGGTGVSQALAMREVHAERSPFQRIDVHDHPGYGRVLVLDQTVQGSRADEAIYHEMAVHVPLLAGARPRRRVLVVGGGDLGIVREVLRHDEVERVVLVEIDDRVIDVSTRLFPLLDGGAPDPRLEDLAEAPEATRELALCLERQLEQQLDLALSLLALVCPRQEVRLARWHLRGAGAKRAYAVELLESVMPRAAKPLLAPLVHDLSPDERRARLAALVPVERRGLTARIDELAGRSAPAWAPAWARVAALHAAGALGDRALDAVVRNGVTDPRRHVAETARWALERLGARAA